MIFSIFPFGQATLMDVVNHYDQAFALGLSADQKYDLVESLKSL